MDSSAIHGCALNYDGLDNPIFTDQFDFMDCFDEELAAILGEGFDGSLSSPENTCVSSSSSSSTIPVSSFPATSTPIVLSFGNAPQRPPSPGDAPVTLSRPQSDPGDLQPKRVANTKRNSRIRPPSQTYDHIIAERKRREQLSQHFLALSTIVPGLKKMDKTSVLGDAITYLKDLQGRVKTLEEEASKKSMESVVLVKKSRMMFEDGDEDGDEKEQWLPEIEARVCDTQILIRIQCEKRKGLLTQLIGLVENLNLSIVNTSATAFGMVALEITIITKMEKEFNLSVNEVLKRLHGAIKNAS